ncbi:hypothetical protein Q9X91_004261 [Vibrio alginolyticus]|nr:hypothetical protein [Vibrio alginolyticus]
MFEFIGIVVVVWFSFKIIGSYLRFKKSSNSVEIGKEARYIATQELGVPDKYYNFSVLNHMEDVKNGALQLQKHPSYNNLSWSRLLAWTIYGGFRHDCEQWHYGNPIAQQKLDFDIKLCAKQITNELTRDKLTLLIDEPETQEHKTKESGTKNYTATSTGFTVKDTETGHILAAKLENGTYHAVVIMPEQGLELPLSTWNIGESPFNDDNCYEGTQTTYSDKGQWWFQVRPSKTFTEIMMEVESLSFPETVIEKQIDLETQFLLSLHDGDYDRAHQLIVSGLEIKDQEFADKCSYLAKKSDNSDLVQLVNFFLRKFNYAV